MGWSSAVTRATEHCEAPAASLDRAALYHTHVAFVVHLLSGGFGYRVGHERRFVRVHGAFDVEDLTQEAFAQLFRQIDRGSFDPTRPVRPYLGRIATNLALRRFRHTCREIPYDELEIPVSPPDPLEAAESAELLDAFRATLSPRELEVVEAYYQTDGATQASAGRVLALSRDQVARTVTKIRRKAIRFFDQRGWFT